MSAWDWNVTRALKPAREPLPIFSIITREGAWYRSYIEEADAEAVYVADPRDRDESSAYHDTGGIIAIPWAAIATITRDGEG